VCVCVTRVLYTVCDRRVIYSLIILVSVPAGRCRSFDSTGLPLAAASSAAAAVVVTHTTHHDIIHARPSLLLRRAVYHIIILYAIITCNNILWDFFFSEIFTTDAHIVVVVGFNHEIIYVYIYIYIY